MDWGLASVETRYTFIYSLGELVGQVEIVELKFVGSILLIYGDNDISVYGEFHKKHAVRAFEN